MPFKHNSARRHRIGKMKFKVTNDSGIATPSKIEVPSHPDPCTNAKLGRLLSHSFPTDQL